jgi:hypothetical protein
MKIPLVLATLIGILVVACSTVAPTQDNRAQQYKTAFPQGLSAAMETASASVDQGPSYRLSQALTAVPLVTPQGLRLTEPHMDATVEAAILATRTAEKLKNNELQLSPEVSSIRDIDDED